MAEDVKAKRGVRPRERSTKRASEVERKEGGRKGGRKMRGEGNEGLRKGM